MSQSKDKPEQSRPRDVIKMPTPEEKPDYIRRIVIEGDIAAGYSANEAEQRYRDLMETLDDPARFTQFVKTQELIAHYGADAVLRTMQGMADYLEERDKPKADLKLWTEAEGKRRSKPRDVKDTPERL